MLSVYIEFSTAMLWAISDWLLAEPVCYVWGGWMFCMVLKLFNRMCGR